MYASSLCLTLSQLCLVSVIHAKWRPPAKNTRLVPQWQSALFGALTLLWFSRLGDCGLVITLFVCLLHACWLLSVRIHYYNHQPTARAFYVWLLTWLAQFCALCCHLVAKNTKTLPNGTCSACIANRTTFECLCSVLPIFNCIIKVHILRRGCWLFRYLSGSCECWLED